MTQLSHLQYTATHCKHTAAHCNTLQHTATHCNTLHDSATHCNTFQHTATGNVRAYLGVAYQTHSLDTHDDHSHLHTRTFVFVTMLCYGAVTLKFILSHLRSDLRKNFICVGLFSKKWLIYIGLFTNRTRHLVSSITAQICFAKQSDVYMKMPHLQNQPHRKTEIARYKSCEKMREKKQEVGLNWKGYSSCIFFFPWSRGVE